jgi:hypothetical protein
MRSFMRWMKRFVVVLTAAFVVLYGGDWAIYQLRGSPQSKVTVNRYVTIPLKGGRREYDYLGSTDLPCATSLFAQSGLDACWQLRRNPNQGMIQ